jgi:hypothetical protein
VLIAKELHAEFKEQLTHVLQMYKDVFVWSYEDMNGLNPEFYHHKINLAKDASWPGFMELRRSRNYVILRKIRQSGIRVTGKRGVVF